MKSNLHDKFFKEVLSRKKIAIDFIKHFLPEKVTRKIDYESWTRLNNGFVDGDLRSILEGKGS